MNPELQNILDKFVRLHQHIDNCKECSQFVPYERNYPTVVDLCKTGQNLLEAFIPDETQAEWSFNTLVARRKGH